MSIPKAAVSASLRSSAVSVYDRSNADVDFTKSLSLPDAGPLPSPLFDLLETIAALTGELGYPPTLTELGESYGFSRQRAHQMVAKLRGRGLLEDPPFQRATRSIVLSHNGKLLLETALDAGLKE